MRRQGWDVRQVPVRTGTQRSGVNLGPQFLDDSERTPATSVSGVAQGSRTVNGTTTSSPLGTGRGLPW